MPSNRALKTMNAVHRVILTASGGRLGWEASAMPVIRLTTTGRKSGQRRSVMLTSPLQEGSTIVVVASRGGDDHHPAWFLNLRDDPDVEVVVQGGPAQRMHAHIATDEQRSRLWPPLIAAHKNYAGYQDKTSREIPLVMLEPTS
ncbi:MAG: nitroreductase family deazaflavin-dependent oxidoreductase [Actinomycetota bacterium]|nr:nitroreductase family deazaflavin-dependent oxidoreductase [Actinomycetota bacterium]